MKNKYQLSPEMKSFANNIIGLAEELQKIEELNFQHGQENKFCCINVSEHKSINTTPSCNVNEQDFSLLIQIACEDSELLDFWKRNIENFQPYGFEIVKVHEFCHIYLQNLLCRLIEHCKTF